MRELTVAEYRTILAILTHSLVTERERIRLSRLPSSTYNVARRRLFNEGWLSEVMIPNPGPCGYAGVEFLLTRPSLSTRERVLHEWSNDPDCVLLWAGLHAVFGVFFRPTAAAVARSVGSPDGVSTPHRVFAGRRSGVIPVYFDYSGLWARFGREPPPTAYPLGLDPAADAAGHRALSAALGLLHPDASVPEAQLRWTSFLRFPRTPRSALELGVVQSRTVLNVLRLPAFDGRRIGELIFIQGRLRPGLTVQRLLSVLVRECGVSPFLACESAGDLILAGVGQTSSAAPGRVPVATARRPVMATLTEHVEPAAVLIEPVEAIEEPVRHRYPSRIPALAAARMERSSNARQAG